MAKNHGTRSATGWIVLFFAQTILVAAHRTDLHRRLGVAGAILAGTMIAVTIEFDSATGSRLSIRSDVPKRLANGHRELLTVRAPDGSVVLERLLDTQSGDVAVDLAAIAAGRQAPQEFFGIAFWLGFGLHLVAAEVYINRTRPKGRIPTLPARQP